MDCCCEYVLDELICLDELINIYRPISHGSVSLALRCKIDKFDKKGIRMQRNKQKNTTLKIQTNKIHCHSHLLTSKSDFSLPVRLSRQVIHTFQVDNKRHFAISQSLAAQKKNF